MSEKVSHHWAAQSQNLPQHRALVHAVPLPSGRWRVWRQQLMYAHPAREIECDSDETAIAAARELMTEIPIFGEWTYWKG